MQLAYGSVHPEGSLAIEIGLQAGRDLANEATQACQALQFGVVGHSRPPRSISGAS